MPAELPPPPERFGLVGEAVVAVPAVGQTLYRLLRQVEPRPADFRSNRDRSRPPAPRETVLLHSGISLFSSPEAALARARRRPAPLAAVTLEAGHGLYLAKTGSRFHYTAWGEPDRLAALAALPSEQR